MTDGNGIDDAADDLAVSDDAVDDDAADDGGRPVDGRLRIVAFGVLPAVVVALGAGAGVLGWQESSEREVRAARIKSVSFGADATIVGQTAADRNDEYGESVLGPVSAYSKFSVDPPRRKTATRRRPQVAGQAGAAQGADVADPGAGSAGGAWG